MPRQYKPKELVKILERNGFVLTRQKGSHARYKHPDGRMVSVPMHIQELPKGTLHSILKQSGFNPSDF
jgi:predicted RNA binding protein YcfA (HicA-like mRNA interferase family)